MNKTKLYLALANFSFALCAGPASAADRQWINGQWFDGEKFVPRTVYTVDGRLTLKAPAKPLPVEDLRGRFVVPPYGDAHHHGIDGPDGLDEKIATFLRQGIFYVKNPNVIPDYLDASVRSQLNRADSIDVVFSNGGLTGSGGHPGPLHAKLASNGVFKGMTPSDMEGRAYFIIDSQDQLEAKWPSILEGKPDFLKTYLNGDHLLETHQSHRGGEAGLRPDVLKAVVKKAQRHKLRVSTHVDTAADFGVAVRAGVDEINHMPLAEPMLAGSIQAAYVSWQDAVLAAKRKVLVVMTANVIHRFSGKRWNAEAHARVTANQRANIALLNNAGVRLAIGSDGISGEKPFVTALDEARYLHQRGLATNLQLLRMWTENTADTIFPARRIGHLREGFEANFLVLEDSPLDDFANFQRIAQRVKAGETIQVMVQ